MILTLVFILNDAINLIWLRQLQGYIFDIQSIELLNNYFFYIYSFYFMLIYAFLRFIKYLYFNVF